MNMNNVKTLYKFCLSRICIYNFSLWQHKSRGKLSVAFYFNYNFQLMCYLPVNVSFPRFLSTLRLLLFWNFVKNAISCYGGISCFMYYFPFGEVLRICLCHLLLSVLGVIVLFSVLFPRLRKKNCICEYWLTNSNFECNTYRGGSRSNIWAPISAQYHLRL